MISGALANHLWQSTLVAALACIVTLALRRERAAVRYGVWLAASLKFLVPLGAVSSLGARFGWRPIVVASFTPHEVIVDASGGPLPPAAIRVVNYSAPHSTLTMLADVLPGVLTVTWAAGAAVLLAIWFVRWRRVALVVRNSQPLESGPVFDALRRLERSEGIARPTRLVSSASALEPGVFGLIAQTLVWPRQLSDHLTSEQIEGIIAHEIAHVRRRDNLAALCHLFVQAAFWFHPMVWWIGSRLVEERERACDEAVVRRVGARDAYAESILKTCQFFVESPIACVSGVTGSDLKKRIEHIMTSDMGIALNAWKKCFLAAACLAVLAVPFVIGVMTVRDVHAQQPAAQPTHMVIEQRIRSSIVDLERARARASDVYKQAKIGAATTPGAAFDVTSVKPNNTGSGMIRMLPAANGGWQAENVTLGMLVRLANQLQDNQIVGGPKWLFEDRFDVMGTGTAPGRDGPMFDKLKQLMADRFKLVTHMETREQSMYALVLARSDGKLGDKMTQSAADCTPTGPNGRGRGQGAIPAPGERPKCGFMIGPGRLMAGGQTMASVATNLSRFVGGIVVDKTNLKGTYDIELTYAMDPGISLTGRDLPPQPGAPPPIANSDAPSIFVAVQEQLGLKLEATKGPVDVLVIDSAERPTAD